MFKTLFLNFLLVPPVPGSFCTKEDPHFNEYRYTPKIAHCKRAVSTKRRIAICKRDGVKDRKDFTVDHIIPLSIGGSNKDDNLWCQHKSLNVNKLEYQTYLKLKKGQINQQEAVKIILDAKNKRK